MSPEGFRKIIVAVDGSESSKKAARVAVDLAEKYGAELVALHVIPRLTYEFTPTSLTRAAVPPTGYGLLYGEARREAEKYVSDTMSMAKARNVSARGDILEDKPSIVEAIIDFAATEGADLIVTGTRGRSGFAKLLVGSVSGGVMAHAPSPVLIVR